MNSPSAFASPAEAASTLFNDEMHDTSNDTSSLSTNICHATATAASSSTAEAETTTTSNIDIGGGGANAAALARAIDVIRNGGTQAEAAIAAKEAVRDYYVQKRDEAKPEDKEKQPQQQPEKTMGHTTMEKHDEEETTTMATTTVLTGGAKAEIILEPNQKKKSTVTKNTMLIIHQHKTKKPNVNHNSEARKQEKEGASTTKRANHRLPLTSGFGLLNRLRGNRKKKQNKVKNGNNHNKKQRTKTTRTTHYDVLGISKKATQGEIQKAYRRRCRETHPDSKKLNDNHNNRNGDDDEEFHQVCEAYSILNSIDTRAIYDKELVENAKKKRKNKMKGKAW